MEFKKKIFIKNKIIKENKCFIVAEISANHCGKLSIMKRLISKLKNAGADAIKIQAYEASTITIKSSNKDFKIKKNNSWSNYDTLYSLYKKAQTPFAWYPKIFEFCKKKNIIIFASVFDIKSLKILEKLKCPAYKIASPEITDIPLIKAAAKTKKILIISNGLSNIHDLNLAIKTIKKEKNRKLVLLKCTSAYPTPLDEVNLNTMEDMKERFNCLTGFSDHTAGYNVSIHAASMGATILEKHVCLDNKKSVDSFFSIKINEFKKMVKIIKNNEISSGKIDYEISNSSRKNLNGRRSIYVVKEIKKGELFTENNIRSIRPSFGMHPKNFEKILNKKSRQNIKAGSRLLWKHIK